MGFLLLVKYLVFGLIAGAAGLVDLGLFVLVLLRIGTQFFAQAVVVGEPQFSILQYYGAAVTKNKIKYRQNRWRWKEILSISLVLVEGSYSGCEQFNWICPVTANKPRKPARITHWNWTVEVDIVVGQTFSTTETKKGKSAPTVAEGVNYLTCLYLEKENTNICVGNSTQTPHLPLPHNRPHIL